MRRAVERGLVRRGVAPCAFLIFSLLGCAKRDGTRTSQSHGGASAGSDDGPMLILAGNTSTSMRRLAVTAESTLVEVTIGQTPRKIRLEATQNGVPVDASWTVDRGDIGSISPAIASSVAFVATGKTGGVVKVGASFGDDFGEVTLSVRITGTQNGPRSEDASEKGQIAGSVSDLTRGGGIAGVGGEGLGPGVTDERLRSGLSAPTESGDAQKLALLYPYDGTVWPRGMLAPLLMWDWSLGDADAIRIALSTASGTFSWSGSFGRPAILEPLRAAQTTDAARAKLGRFTRHPIPQEVWEMATNTATAKDPLELELTVAKDGIAYGPISQSRSEEHTSELQSPCNLVCRLLLEKKKKKKKKKIKKKKKKKKKKHKEKKKKN